ncbi:MAG: aldose 1-epimerase [Neolewinella sp.]
MEAKNGHSSLELIFHRNNYTMKYLPLLLLLLLCTCGRALEKEVAEIPTTTPGLSLTDTLFGQTPDGPVTKYTLQNEHGMQVSILDRGGIITNIIVPDRDGELADVVLGFDNIDGYLGKYPYFGALIGRYGNRIANGRFSIDGKDYTLATNNGPNSLHGGLKGFDRKRWKATLLKEESRVGVSLSGVSPDGEEGYPGNLSISVTYWLNNGNELLMEYEAKTDEATVVNLTNHSYFNLKGAGNGDILDHVLTLHAGAFTPVDSTLIPNGTKEPVEGTAFDFRQPTAIGVRIDSDSDQMTYGGGYDHNFVLDRTGAELAEIAAVYEPTTGRTLEVETSEPGVQFYSGNFLDGSKIGKGNIPYEFRTGFCLETQHFPDSPNQPNFPSTLLQPGETYGSSTIYRFGVRE